MVSVRRVCRHHCRYKCVVVSFRRWSRRLCRRGRRDRHSGRLRDRLKSKSGMSSNCQCRLGRHTTSHPRSRLRSGIFHSVCWCICHVFQFWCFSCLSCHLCRWIWRSVGVTKNVLGTLEVPVSRILCPLRGDIGVSASFALNVVVVVL